MNSFRPAEKPIPTKKNMDQYLPWRSKK